MSETSGEFGIAVGIAGLGSLATFVYRDQLGPYAAAHVSEATTAALDSLAGAVQAGDDAAGRGGPRARRPRPRRRSRRASTSSPASAPRCSSPARSSPSGSCAPADLCISRPYVVDNVVMISRFPAVVDDVTVRLIAAVVLVIGVVALLTSQWWLYAVLAVDFTLRAALGPGQPDRAARAAVDPTRRLRPKRPTAGPPKRFAAAIGAVMTVAATALWLSPSLTGASVAIGGHRHRRGHGALPGARVRLRHLRRLHPLLVA